MLEKVVRQAHRFDLIHFHVDYAHFPFSRRHRRPHVTTLHGRLDIPELPAIYGAFSGAPVVSISDAQRRPLPWLNWQATILHGLPTDLFTFRPKPGSYLAFLGRVSPEKRVDRAIEIARRAGMPLKIAAKIDKADRDYFKQHVERLFDHPLIEYIGEVGGKEKDEFLGNASALLFPIDWPEPFGLVMIEAMACGTPVIAWDKGSVPEVMEDGVNGFVVKDMDQAVRAIEQVSSLNREQCRAVFEERFTVARMAEDYLRVYRQLLTGAEEDKVIGPRARPRAPSATPAVARVDPPTAHSARERPRGDMATSAGGM
jgi:glycosyltransferase involved in cell wall biosynthesis